MRSIFQDEVLGALDGTNDPLYIMEPVGDKVRLRLANPITQAGTPMTASIMNNMFDFDNLASQSGFELDTAFPAGMIAQETITNTETGAIAAQRTTVALSDGSIQEELTLYNDAGTPIRSTRTTTTFTPDGRVREKVEQI